MHGPPRRAFQKPMMALKLHCCSGTGTTRVVQVSIIVCVTLEQARSPNIPQSPSPYVVPVEIQGGSRVSQGGTFMSFP